jgi:hypothetical protein
VAISLGVAAGYSNVVSVDVPFGNDDQGNPFVSTYIIVGGTGDIVWRNALGELQFLQNVSSGTTLGIAAIEIVSSGTVYGVPRTTTATVLSALWSNRY